MLEKGIPKRKKIIKKVIQKVMQNEKTRVANMRNKIDKKKGKDLVRNVAARAGEHYKINDRR